MNRRAVAAIVCVAAKNIMFDSDNDPDEEYDDKIYNFSEEVVPFMSARQFQLHFRMKPHTFEVLLGMLHNVSDHNVNPGRPSVDLEKQAMILIWCLANRESFRSVANRFGITKSTCWGILYSTCEKLLKINQKYGLIQWPSEEEATNTANYLYEHWGVPGICGAVDGSHIPIIAPKENHNSYVNRKSFHSILLQGVCNQHMMFLDVHAGEPGSVHDWTLFKKSSLYRRIECNEVQFYNDKHLIGDLAYPIKQYLLVGFKDNGYLTEAQKKFNLHLSKARAVIEHAFALLKGRFRRLKSLETVRLDCIALLTISGCILHNICLLENDKLEEIINLEEEIESERQNNPATEILVQHPENTDSACMKRLNIVNSLMS